jgi:hypothetical protein
MKDPLKKVVIAITGDFGGKSRSIENIKRWIESNGGKYSTKIEDGVTHLICSKENWKKQVPAGITPFLTIFYVFERSDTDSISSSESSQL